MKLRTVPARQGYTWVRRGFQAFFRQPLAFSALFAVFLFLVFVLSLLPLLGAVLLLALLPLGSLGFMIATRESLAGRSATPRAFVEPLRRGRPALRAMVALGVAYAGASLLIIWLSDLVDGGTLDALMDLLSQGKASGDVVAERLADGRLQAGLLLRFGLAALLSVPYWHAPALVHWGGQGVAQSLFSSTLACWRNKAAFTLFGLAWAGVVLGFGLVANLAAMLLGQPQLVALAAMPASLLLSTVFYASLYFTFDDCFERPDAPHPLPSSTDAAATPPADTP